MGITMGKHIFAEFFTNKSLTNKFLNLFYWISFRLGARFFRFANTMLYQVMLGYYPNFSSSNLTLSRFFLILNLNSVSDSWRYWREHCMNTELFSKNVELSFLPFGIYNIFLSCLVYSGEGDIIVWHPVL